jgi:hypothetical protein
MLVLNGEGWVDGTKSSNEHGSKVMRVRRAIATMIPRGVFRSEGFAFADLSVCVWCYSGVAWEIEEKRREA